MPFFGLYWVHGRGGRSGGESAQSLLRVFPGGKVSAGASQIISAIHTYTSEIMRQRDHRGCMWTHGCLLPGQSTLSPSVHCRSLWPTGCSMLFHNATAAPLCVLRAK